MTRDNLHPTGHEWGNPPAARSEDESRVTLQDAIRQVIENFKVAVPQAAALLAVVAAGPMQKADRPAADDDPMRMSVNDIGRRVFKQEPEEVTSGGAYIPPIDTAFFRETVQKRAVKIKAGDPNADTAIEARELFEADVKFISLVDRPANRAPWKMVKSTGSPEIDEMLRNTIRRAQQGDESAIRALRDWEKEQPTDDPLIDTGYRAA